MRRRAGDPRLLQRVLLPGRARPGGSHRDREAARLRGGRRRSFCEGDADLAARAPAAVAELAAAREAHGVRFSDLFFVPGATFEEIAPNQRDAAGREQARRLFAAAVTVADELEIPGITFLPGIPWVGDSAAGWDVCAEELRWRVDEGARRGVGVGMEAHIGSIVSTPELDARDDRGRAGTRGHARPLALRRAGRHRGARARARAARAPRARARVDARCDPGALEPERGAGRSARRRPRRGRLRRQLLRRVRADAEVALRRGGRRQRVGATKAALAGLGVL